MVEPCVKRSLLDRDDLTDMKKNQDVMKRKVDECEFVIHKAQKKTASQLDIQKKMEYNVSPFLFVFDKIRKLR